MTSLQQQQWCPRGPKQGTLLTTGHTTFAKHWIEAVPQDEETMILSKVILSQFHSPANCSTSEDSSRAYAALHDSDIALRSTQEWGSTFSCDWRFLQSALSDWAEWAFCCKGASVIYWHPEIAPQNGAATGLTGVILLAMTLTTATITGSRSKGISALICPFDLWEVVVVCS